MTGTIFQLGYVSSRVETLARDEVAQILNIARIRNRQDGVTGLLLFNGTRFLQHLEGSASAVQATYARIERDSRHFGIAPLYRRTADARAFTDWAMAFELVAGDRQSLANPSLSDQVDALVAQAPVDVARTFRGYARLGPSGNAA